MKRIFDENYKIFTKTCNQCGCRFSYETEDICGNWDHVYCPCCGKYLTTNEKIIYDKEIDAITDIWFGDPEDDEEDHVLQEQMDEIIRRQMPFIRFEEDGKY